MLFRFFHSPSLVQRHIVHKRLRVNSSNMCRNGDPRVRLPVQTGQRQQSVPESVVLTDPLWHKYLAALLPSIQPGQGVHVAIIRLRSKFQSRPHGCRQRDGNRSRHAETGQPPNFEVRHA